MSWLYELGMDIRNWMFEKGYKKQVSFEDQVAVICVGNVAVGGTGKTPHIEYLIRLLQKHNIGPIAVLSRGYKRQSHGFVLAGKEKTATQLGDESYQLHRKFPDVIVAVDEKRVRGIRELLKLENKPKVILLDDAFQHRYVKPGLSIVLTSYTRIIYKDMVLPAGRLRESQEGVKRADLLVVTKCPNALREEEITELHAKLPTRLDQPIFYSAYRYANLVNLETNLPEVIDPTSQVLVLAGIADPSVLQSYVQKHFRLLDMLTYDDHHHFSNKDIKHIQERLEGLNEMGYCSQTAASSTIIITTEKDAARLVDHPALTTELRSRIYYLPTEVYFLKNQEEKIDKIVLNYVNKERKG
ncbi:MAG: tetraacyldisaccharide 4'-kinase [Bacteroidales bacterium]|nr:tetraacyldisaccharide 4'-kinase [Bacteroidales bacterium]